MSEKFSIQYLPVAVDDLTAIFDFIAENSPSRALAFVEMLDKRIGVLSVTPFMGRVPRDLRLQKMGYRVLILDNYLVFYSVRGHVIEIDRVVRGSRLLDNLL